MTDETTPLAVIPERDNIAQPQDYFDGNEQELPEPDEDLDDEITSPDDELDDADPSDDEGDTEGGDETDEETDDGSDPETVEVEFNGQKYKVPAALKDGFLMQGDYTRKTQEVAEQRKAVDAERTQVQQMAQMTQEEIGALVDLRNIDAQLEQYQKVNWQAAFQEDPFGAQSARAAFDDLKDKRAAALQSYQQASGKRSEAAKQATAKRLQETAEYAQKNIPNWSPELDLEITRYAESKGFDRDTLKNAYTPQVYEILHKAFIGEQLMAKQAAAKPKPKSQAPKKPLTTVKPKGQASGQKDISDMSMDEYADYMNAKERKRKAANPR